MLSIANLILVVVDAGPHGSCAWPKSENGPHRAFFSTLESVVWVQLALSVGRSATKQARPLFFGLFLCSY